MHLRMALTSMGLGQTCSNSTLPRWCARTSFIPSIKSAPNVAFLAAVFLGILFRSPQIGRDLSQLLLLIHGQIGLHVLGVASDQINASRNHDIQVNDPAP